MYLSVGSHESVCPENVGKIAFLASEWVGAFSKIFPGLFPASPGAQLQEITSYLFRFNWVKNDCNRPNIFFDPIDDCNRIRPNWIEKLRTVISCNSAPGEAGVQHVMHRWRYKSHWLGYLVCPTCIGYWTLSATCSCVHCIFPSTVRNALTEVQHYEVDHWGHCAVVRCKHCCCAIYGLLVRIL